MRPAITNISDDYGAVSLQRYDIGLSHITTSCSGFPSDLAEDLRLSQELLMALWATLANERGRTAGAWIPACAGMTEARGA